MIYIRDKTEGAGNWKRAKVIQTRFRVLQPDGFVFAEFKNLPPNVYQLLVCCAEAGIKLAWRGDELIVDPYKPVEPELADHIRTMVPKLLAMRNKALKLSAMQREHAEKNKQAETTGLEYKVNNDRGPQHQPLIGTQNGPQGSIQLYRQNLR